MSVLYLRITNWAHMAKEQEIRGNYTATYAATQTAWGEKMLKIEIFFEFSWNV